MGKRYPQFSLEDIDLELPAGRALGLVGPNGAGKSTLLLALARRAELLILDEPTAGLDPLVRHDLMGILASARDSGQTIVFSSHHSEDVAALAGDVVFLHQGRIIANAPVASLLEG